MRRTTLIEVNCYTKTKTKSVNSNIALGVTGWWQDKHQMTALITVWTISVYWNYLNNCQTFKRHKSIKGQLEEIRWILTGTDTLNKMLVDWPIKKIIKQLNYDSIVDHNQLFWSLQSRFNRVWGEKRDKANETWAHRQTDTQTHT